MTSAEQLASGILTPALVLEVFLKLGIVLILVYLSLRLLRQYSQQNPAANWLQAFKSVDTVKSLRTLQVHPLNRQVTLYLIECEGRKILLSANGQQVTALSEWTEQAAEPDLKAAEAAAVPASASSQRLEQQDDFQERDAL